MKFDTAIDDPEWKSEKQNGWLRPFCKKYDGNACARHNFIRNAPINFIFDVAIDLSGFLPPRNFT